jgi:hypothetical protein
VRPNLEKNPSHKKRMVECLKVYALSSNPSVEKEKKKRTLSQTEKYCKLQKSYGAHI